MAFSFARPSEDGFYARKYILDKQITKRKGVFAIAEVTDNPEYPPGARYILDVFVGRVPFEEVRIEWFSHGFGWNGMTKEEMDRALDTDIQTAVENSRSWDLEMEQLDHVIKHHYEGT